MDPIDEFLAAHPGFGRGDPTDEDLNDYLENDIANGRLAGSTSDPRMDAEFALRDGEEEGPWYLPEEWDDDDDLD